jgi:hypothetical protein
MNVPSFRPLPLLASACAVFAAGTVTAQPIDSEVRLTIAAAQYTVGSERFDDLAGVDAWLASHRGRVVALDVCPPAATPRLLAAVERFQPSGSLDIRTLAPSAPGCAAPAASATAVGVGFLNAEEYLATDANGRSIIP